MSSPQLTLLDTNVISELVRPMPNENVVEWFGNATSTGTFLLSTISVEEIAFGIARVEKSRRAKLQKWFDALLASEIQIEPVSQDVAVRAGTLRGTLSLKGQPRSSADLLIAATALLRNAVLATRNTKDFANCGVILLNPFDEDVHNRADT